MLFQECFGGFVVGFGGYFLDELRAFDFAVLADNDDGPCIETSEGTLFNLDAKCLAEVGAEARGGLYVFDAVDGAESGRGKREVF